MRRTSADRQAEAARYRELTQQAQSIPTVSSSFCKYDKDRQVLSMSSQHVGMPKTLFIRSHITGKEVRFVSVDENDILFDQDQWDGEQQIYRPLGNVNGIDYLVISNLI